MIQLSYQPVFDPFHTIFRILRLREAVVKKSTDIDLVRILDFYLLFPFRINEIRVLPAHRSYKKLGKRFENKKPYGEHPDDMILFDRMKPIQLAAIGTLASRGFFDGRQITSGKIELTEKPVPHDLLKKIEGENTKEDDLIQFLTILASEYELLGSNGLKARSNLLEYRYDAV